MLSPRKNTRYETTTRRGAGLALSAVLLLLAGCAGERQRDVLGAQYYPDPAYGGRRTAFQPYPQGYAPPPVAPATQYWPPGPF